MSTQRVVSQSTLPVVGQNQVPGTTLMFCNGIENDLENAKSSAQIISNAFGNRQVYVYHNPTTLRDYLSPKIEQFSSQIDLAASLAREIHRFILLDRQNGMQNRQISVVLFAHSHGVVVSELALPAIYDKDPEAKQSIRVYAFGGATVIPNQLASGVRNYMFDEDLVSDLGNARSKSKMILYQTKRITKLMSERSLPLFGAILEQSYSDLFMELYPISRIGHSEDRNTRTDKNNRYQQIFEQKNLAALGADPFFNEQIRKYGACFTDYNIVIIDGTPFQHPNYYEIDRGSNIGEFFSNLTQNLSSMGANFVNGITAVGHHALRHHEFSAYLDKIQEVAQHEASIARSAGLAVALQGSSSEESEASSEEDASENTVNEVDE